MSRICHLALRNVRSKPLGILNSTLRHRPVTHTRLLSVNQYHQVADDALDTITESWEDLINTKPEIDVDLGYGVLTLTTPPAGTYVINKQPPNLQIWLSSPISGPKHYDYNETTKQWVCERDNSTLGELLRREARETYSLDLPLDLE